MDETLQIVPKIISILDCALKKSENYQVYYYRALLLFVINNMHDSLENVDIAI